MTREEFYKKWDLSKELTLTKEMMTDLKDVMCSSQDKTEFYTLSNQLTDNAKCCN